VLQETLSLSTKVKDSWLDVLTGNNLLSRAAIEMEAETLRASLTIDPSNALEQLIISDIILHWLALQNAIKTSSEYLHKYGSVPATQERHWSACQSRYLASVRELARVKSLLSPKTKLQVNIAQQAVNVS